MRFVGQILSLFLMLVPGISMASENLIENLFALLNVAVSDGVVSQLETDAYEHGTWKLMAVYSNEKHTHLNDTQTYEGLQYFFDNKTGFISTTFTTPDDLEDLSYFRFGTNGHKQDTLVGFNIKNVIPSAKYTLQWRVLNATQGQVAWTDMLVIHCPDGYELALGDTACSRACENQYVPGGYIPPDSARVYAQDECTYATANMICDAAYVLTGGVCERLCDAGITRMYFGASFKNLYARKITTPALSIYYNGRVCYGKLSPGRGMGLNLKTNNEIYHLSD